MNSFFIGYIHVAHYRLWKYNTVLSAQLAGPCNTEPSYRLNLEPQLGSVAVILLVESTLTMAVALVGLNVGAISIISHILIYILMINNNALGTSYNINPSPYCIQLKELRIGGINRKIDQYIRNCTIRPVCNLCLLKLPEVIILFFYKISSKPPLYTKLTDSWEIQN